MPGSQDFAGDPRNDTVLIYLNGALVRRAEAKVRVEELREEINRHAYRYHVLDDPEVWDQLAPLLRSA